ncbi:MAG TPA: hypothetical protein VK815_17155 [Candidatus Acidoferrales bacterium]|jgi:hypothetical protein|nr:hypothetical protein [Candidatus Acidoferrales bacterium]
MKTQIDLKSVLLGLVTGVGIMFTVGAGTVPKEVGRYQVAGGQLGAVIIDTKTGQAWGYTPSSTQQNRIDDTFWDAK